MSTTKSKRTRRAFFLQSGAAALGAAGVAAAGAAPKSIPLEEREAIRQLQLTFAALIENQSDEAAAQLFEDRALLNQYRDQSAPVVHTAYRSNALQQKDQVQLSEDGSQAAATWHVDVRLSTPLEGDCTAAQMARLQGNLGDCRWETGRLEAKYVKTAIGKTRVWRIASLRYRES